MSRGVVALLAWPGGILLAVVVSVALAPSCHAAACQLEPVPSWQTLLELALGLGPGVVATARWWYSRGGQ